jgi:hypothetical protein
VVASAEVKSGYTVDQVEDTDASEVVPGKGGEALEEAGTIEEEEISWTKIRDVKCGQAFHARSTARVLAVRRVGVR